MQEACHYGLENRKYIRKVHDGVLLNRKYDKAILLLGVINLIGLVIKELFHYGYFN